MKQPSKHPRLTALRALALIRKVEKARGSSEESAKNMVLQDVALILEDHIAADIVRRKK